MTNPALAAQMEQLRQRLESIQGNQQKTQERFAKLDSMREEVAAIEASVTSKDRSVTVVAGPGGSVKSVQFTDDAKRLTPIQLSQAVMSTLQQAVAEAARQQAAVVQGYLGDDINIAERVMKTQEDLLGHALHANGTTTQAESAPDAGGGRPARHAAPQDDSEEEELSVFGSEPTPNPRPSTPSGSSDGGGYLRLYDGEDR